MSHRVNVIVQDDVWALLKRIPAGERSRIVNAALREWAQKRCRLDAAAEMDRLRANSAAKTVTTAEIVRWIREGRDGGH